MTAQEMPQSRRRAARTSKTARTKQPSWAEGRTLARLRASERRYRALFEAIDEGFCVVEVRLGVPATSTGPADERIDYRVIEANKAFHELTGLPQSILNCWLREALPKLEEHWYETYGQVARTGEPLRFEQESSSLGRWFDVYAFRVDDPAEQHVAILFDDVSERKRHEEHTQVLLHELNHRSKNMLSLVQAIAYRTASAGTPDFLESFGRRLRALATAQDLLIENAWRAVPLVDLVRAQLAHFTDAVEDRVTIAGPSLVVLPDAVHTLGMAMHELATNAAKHGALSNEDGHVLVDWSVVVDEASGSSLILSWRERGGPPVPAPDRRGFGSTVTTDMVQASTGGAVSADYAPSGLTWRLVCPAPNVLVGPFVEAAGGAFAQDGAGGDVAVTNKGMGGLPS